MAEMQIFNNAEFGEIRTTTINGEPWLVGKDVAAALGYTNPQKALRDHVYEDDRTVNESFTVNGTRGTLINESGLYALIFGSKLESAKRFKRWVTGEVLPTIRKTGAYGTPRNGDAESFTIKQYPGGFQAFQHSRFGEIRVLTDNKKEAWYFGTDITRALDYGNTCEALRDAIYENVDPEYRRLLWGGEKIIREPAQKSGAPESGVPIVNETGVYELILSRKVPAAKAFTRWMTDTVFPSVRQNGFRNPIQTVAPVPISPVPTTANYTPSSSVIKKREPTFDECLKAAELVMNCGDERLPYVLAMLRQYGFEIPDVRRKSAKAKKEESAVE